LLLACSSNESVYDDPAPVRDAQADQATRIDVPDVKLSDAQTSDVARDTTLAIDASDGSRDANDANAPDGFDGQPTDGPLVDGVSPDRTACVSTSLGHAADLGFTVEETGGLPWARSDRDTCTFHNVQTTYGLAAKTYTQRGCIQGVAIDESYRLSDDDVTRIRAQLASLDTTCAPACAVDAPDVRITVRSGSGERRYRSEFNSDCQNHTDQSPSFGFYAYVAFRTSLSVIMNGCSQSSADAAVSDASAATDAGADADATGCQPRQRIESDAGVDGARE